MSDPTYPTAVGIEEYSETDSEKASDDDDDDA